MVPWGLIKFEQQFWGSVPQQSSNINVKPVQVALSVNQLVNTIKKIWLVNFAKNALCNNGFYSINMSIVPLISEMANGFCKQQKDIISAASHNKTLHGAIKGACETHLMP